MKSVGRDSRKLITAAIVASGLLAGSLSARAAVLHQNVRVSDPGTTDATIANGNTSRKLAVGVDGTIYAVYRSEDHGVRVARSSDRGASFTPSVQVNPNDFEAEVIVSNTGIVYVAWVDSVNQRAMVSRSLDGALTFSTPVDAGPAISTVHLAADANRLYIIDRPGNTFLASSDNGLTFNAVDLNSMQAFSDVHVDGDSGEVFVQIDDPAVKYYVSRDFGATFPDGMIYPSPAGSVYFSVGALSVGDAGRYLLVAGSGEDTMRINVDTQVHEVLKFGNNEASQGRSLTADRCSNVVDGYVSGTNANAKLMFRVSNDLGDTFGPATEVAAVPADPMMMGMSNDQQANVFINQTNGDVLFLYSKDGEAFLSTYSKEVPCYLPQLSTSALVYNALLPGTSSTPKSVLLTNDSDSDLVISDITATGEFDVGPHSCVGTLAPGASCEVPVTFNPATLGAHNGKLQITTNDFPQPRIVNLRGESVTHTPVPTFASNESARLAGSFGARSLGVAHNSVVTLTNDGNQDLVINGFSVMGAAFSYTHNCPATLAPGASCEVTLTFSPSALGEYSGTLTLDSNTSGAPATIALKGVGTDQAQPEPEPNTVPVEVRGRSGGGGSFDLLLLFGAAFLLALKKVNRRYTATMLASLGIVATQAQADDTNSWYVGGQFGSARSDVSAGAIDASLRNQGYAVSTQVSDKSRNAWRLYAGYELNNWLALETGYSELGEVKLAYSGAVADLNQFLIDANALQPPSAEGFDLTAVARMPLGERVSVHARAGAFFWDARYDTGSVGGPSVRRKDDGISALAGAGAQVVFGKWGVGAEFTRYGVDGDHVDFAGVDLTYRW